MPEISMNEDIYGSDLYSTPKKATWNLADKEHYLHTINVITGEIVKCEGNNGN